MGIKIITWMMLLVLGSGVLAQADILTVGFSGDAEFDSIQAAIDIAIDGDVVLVEAGTYNEPILIKGKDIEIIGEGPGESVIQTDEPVVRYIGEASGRLEGFTIRYLGTEDEPAILVFNSSPLIVNNEITQATLAGIEIQSDSDVILFGNHIHLNLGTGVLIHVDSTAQVTSNIIEQNGLGLIHHPGLEVRANGEALIQFNQFMFNGGSGVFVQDQAVVDLLGNTILGNRLNGVNAREQAEITLTSNSIWWNVMAGVWIRHDVVSSMEANFIMRNHLGLAVSRDPATDADVPSPQENNIFLGNGRDLSGAGISITDLLMTNQLINSAQFGNLLLMLDLMGESVLALRQDYTDNQRQILMTLVQDVELISAAMYADADLKEEAETRYRMVIRLDLNSDAAMLARQALEALGT